jgi:outer membrane biosynthesis protein TonB
VYQGTSQFNITISGNMINPHSEIVFMPLHRSIKQSIGGGKSGNSAAAKASNKSSTTQVEKTIDVGGTTLVKIVQPKAKPKSKKELKKALGAKNEKATRPTPKATAGTEKEAAAKKDSTPESKVTTNEAKSESKVESKHVEQTNSEKNSQVKENSNLVSASSDAALGSSDTNIVYVGQAEMDALQAQEYIQQELAQHWAPPSGMRSDLFAIVTLTIDFEGVIKKVDLATSSGNLLFDTAAKKAAAQITPARWTFGKELSITFKP